MPVVRSCMLVALVASILVGFSFVNRPEEAMVERLLRAQARVAEALQEVAPTPADAAIPAPTATSTDTPAAPPVDAPAPAATATDVVQPVVGIDTPVALTTDTPTSTPTDTAILIDTATPASLPTQTPAPSATSTDISTRPPGAPTETPTPALGLPPLATVPDAPGASVQTQIGPRGGRIESADGRVVVDFPVGAATEPLDIRITKKNVHEMTAPSPDRPIVNAWSFEATRLSADGEVIPVHKFDKALTITARLTSGEMVPYDPRNLAFWTFDDGLQEWLPVPAEVDWTSRTIVARPDHFSDDAITATQVKDIAPLLDGRNTDLHTGAASIGIPISVPPGRGGLQPNLTLSYSSARLGEMRGWASLGSWVGTGWDIDVPNISISQNVDEPSTGNHIHRVFLSIDGFGGEIMQDYGTGQDGGYVWRAMDEQYIKIRSNQQDVNGATWTVWDQKGTKYVLGGGGTSSQFRRYYRENLCGNIRDYRADVQYIEDVLGNRMDFTYDQQRYDHCTNSDYVMSSYPWKITYNGGQAELEFHVSCDEQVDPPNICTRKDAPRDIHDSSCPAGLRDYFAPPVMETRKLDQIEVKVSGMLARRYDFAYGLDTNFAYWGGPTYCPPAPLAGEHKLTQVTVRDRNYVSYPFTTTKFFYGSQHFAFLNSNDAPIWDYNWKHLERVENGFGGKVYFSYVEKWRQYLGSNHWSVRAVSEERHTYGAGQPDTIRSFDPQSGPYQYNYPDPYQKQASSDYVDYFGAAARGFRTVFEYDQAGLSGNNVEHKFYASSPGDWTEEVRTGKEYRTIYRDSGGAQWKRIDTTWDIRYVNNEWVNWDQETNWFTNFVYPSQSVTTLKDGATLTTVNTFDNGNTSCTLTTCFGLLTRVDDNGGVGVGDEVTTKQAYGLNLARWVFVPQYEEKLDAGHGNALLSCVGYYYDGANTRTTAPVLGLRTAVSTATSATQAQCEGAIEFTESANTYFAYETYGNPAQTYGNVAQVSEPYPFAPEMSTPGGAFGWMPGGRYSSAVYDATHHVFPTSQVDLANLQTSTTYDYVIGKPLTVTQPNGNVTTMVYDALGRIDRAYDSQDVNSVPTVKYIYNWGAVPNSTEVDTRVTHYSVSAKQAAVSCMDGFGREIEHRQRYQGLNMSSTRTDYDANGRKFVETAAVADGTSTVCAATPAAVTGRDRRALQYDPLGNVTITDVWQANQTSGTHPQTVAADGGLTSTFCDEDLHLTTRTRDLALRQLTVSEQSGANADCSIGASPYQTIYQYDGAGNLGRVRDAAQNLTDMYYDLAGRKTQMFDPDMGHWYYTYNAAGSLMTQRDARAVTTTLDYDGAQRLIRKSYSDGTPAVSFLYDTYDTTNGPSCVNAATAAGRMTRMTDGAGEHFTCFDVRGAALKTRRTVDGVSYNSSAVYDGLGQVIQQTYPDDDVANYTETLQGQITGLSSDVDGSLPTYNPQTLLSAATFKPWGAVATLPLGSSGPTTSYMYDYRARLTNIQTGTAQNLALTYDNASNVTSVADGTETVNYSYDQLNRLTGATGFSGGLTASYTYNAIGNMLTKQEGGSNLTLAYPASGMYSVRPHAVTSTSGSQNLTLAYDANGNLATQGASTYTYDAENRIRARGVAGGAYVYTYDGNGTLLKRTSVGPPQTATARPNAQGNYSQWVTELQTPPPLPNYESVNEASPDDDGTYLEQSAAGRWETHVYQSAGVPAGAVIEKVTLKFRWKGTGVVGALFMMYRQGSYPLFSNQGIARGPWEGWVTDSWELKGNPWTGRYWTTGDVNGGLEFGLSTYWDGWTPRVTQTWVEVTYRMPTSSTDYIGGVYEKNSDGSVVKYYGALGRTIAMRRVGVGGGQGELNYLLADHLGSAAGLLDATGVLVPNSKQTYWPYGATRSGSLTQTDKLYTGQQQEPGDSALGMYNYKARFYSTTLGRFVSADPSAGSGWSRYTYAGGNPLRYVDPTGYDCVAWNPNPYDCRKAGEDAVNGIVDIARGAREATSDATAEAWNWLYQRVQQIEGWAQATAEYAYSLRGFAREAWRGTYGWRAPVTQRLEAMLLAEVLTSAKPDSIRTMSGSEFFHIVGQVTIVLGCRSITCVSMAAPAFTVGHTIFFTEWDAARAAANPNGFFKIWAHEMEHVAQFEDLGDAFWPWWLGAGAWEILSNCYDDPGCNLSDTWHKQYLEKSAGDHSYP